MQSQTNVLLIFNKAFAYTYYTLQLAQHVFFQNRIHYAYFSRFHGKPLVKPVDLSCNWFKACREMQYNSRVPIPPPPKQASGVV